MGKKGENKMGAKFSLYTVCIFNCLFTKLIFSHGRVGGLFTEHSRGSGEHTRSITASITADQGAQVRTTVCRAGRSQGHFSPSLSHRPSTDLSPFLRWYSDIFWRISHLSSSAWKRCVIILYAVRNLPNLDHFEAIVLSWIGCSKGYYHTSN